MDVGGKRVQGDRLLRFAHRLAARLGVARPRELLAQLTARELLEWQDYDAIEPLGDERADLRAAVIACTVANAMRGRDTAPYQVRDFLVNQETRPKQTPEQIKQVIQLAAMFAKG